MEGAANLLQARTLASSAGTTDLARLKASVSDAAPAEAGRKFEALFATMIVKEMRQGLSEGFFGEGPHADVYAGWLDQFVGEAIARDGGLHVADQVRESLERKQAAELAARQQVSGADTKASVDGELAERATTSDRAARALVTQDAMPADTVRALMTQSGSNGGPARAQAADAATPAHDAARADHETNGRGARELRAEREEGS
ncbi:MAG: rod-binding protein [Planctomycetes bacterium]|nr:rod-binding protein [Planctomycetota bacterium]